MGHWISVEDCRPESCRNVLVTNGNIVDVASYWPDDEECWPDGTPNPWLFHMDFQVNIIVTHWMPIKKLPQKEG